MKIEISPIELLALKKLALVCNAVAMSLKDAGAQREQSALTRTLVEVLGRAEHTPAAERGKARTG